VFSEMCKIHKVKPLIHATGTNDTVSNQPFKSAELYHEVEIGTDQFSGKTVVTPTKRKVEVVSKFSKRTAVQDDQAGCRRG